MDLGKWLADRDLGRLEPLLRLGGIDLDVLSDLDDSDLEKIGLRLGDRKRLLKAVSQSPAFDAVKKGRPGNAAMAGGERRQLTVVFCDLVGSTDLATMLDPEDFRNEIGAFHNAVTRAVGAFNGYVAQLLGDGVLVYFGYPHADEDDAANSVRASLKVIAEVSQLATISHRRLQTRIGIATGPVVVGEIGAGSPAAELSASGGTPNLAARLQSQAAPDRVVIADQTRKLIGDAFQIKPLELVSLKGFDAAVQVWQVLGERLAESRFEAAHKHQLSKFIGRDSEAALLLDRWSTACEGEGQIVLLSGEPGIGKSRITHTLRERVNSTGGVESVLLQCSPYHRNSALYPVVHALEIAAHLMPNHSPAERVDRLEQYISDRGISLAQDARSCLFRLMTPSDLGRLAVADQTPQQQKALTLRALTEIVLGLSRLAPVLTLIEDVHWIDPTTEEWIGQAVDQLREARVLMVVTSRPGYGPSWGSQMHSTHLTMNRLSQRQSAALIESVAGGKSLPAEAIKDILLKADGVPLFIEELTKTVLASDVVEETSTGYQLRGPLQTIAIPSTLQDSLMARLDKLAPAKEVAQVASAIGRNFNRRLLAEALQMGDVALEQALDELQRAEIIFKRGSSPDVSYNFKHALIQDTAYQSMVRSQRVLRHAQIARALEATAPDLVASQPELLAQHHQEAGHCDEAIHYWTAAGDFVWSRTGGREATIHYANAIGLLASRPKTESRSELLLTLHLKRGQALSVTDGYNSQATYQSFENARELARELGRIDDFIRSWSSSAPTLFGAGRAGEVIESIKEIGPLELTSLAPTARVGAMAILGAAQFITADIDRAWGSLEAARLLDDLENVTHQYPIGGADPAIGLRAYMTRIKGMQGYLEQAEKIACEAMQIADARGHPPTIAWAKQIWTFALMSKAEYAEAESTAAQLLEFSLNFGFKTRVATSWFVLGRARIALGKVEDGAVLLRKGYDLWESAGGKFHLSEYGSQAADALLGVGRTQEAREFIAKAQAVKATTDEPFCNAELVRLFGQCLEIDGDIAGAEEQYHKAIGVSESRGLKLFSLRAAVNLARLLDTQARGAEARGILKPLYEWFTEAFDYPDLMRAKATLDALR